MGLLDYVFRKVLSESPGERERVQYLSQYYRARGEELQVLKHDDWLNVPPVVMRVGLVRDIHTGLGHCGRDKLLDAVQASMWWPGLKQTIIEVLTTCPACQCDKLPPPTKEPPRFGNTTAAPGLGWSIDLAGPF
jgi:Integrase zinc binding domain